MRKQILILKLFALVIIASLASCKKEDTYPVTPSITFKSLTKYQNTASNDSLELIFSFTDGDGDIGTAEGDSVNRDVFVRLFEKQNGVFVEFVNLNAPLEYNIPYLVPRGNNSALVGDIKINIDYNILQPNDTIKYELYMKDRARHSSNSITSYEIITNIQ